MDDLIQDTVRILVLIEQLHSVRRKPGPGVNVLTHHDVPSTAAGRIQTNSEKFQACRLPASQ